MHQLYLIFGLQITVGIIEIIVFLLGALVLGFFIHFFITSRRVIPSTLLEPPVLAESAIHDGEDWQSKYYAELELKEQLQRELEEALSNQELLQMEIEELKQALEQKDYQEPAEENEPGTLYESDNDSSEEYLARLKNAQESLREQNRNIALLLEQIDRLKRSEQKYADTVKANELLQARVQELQQQLLQKEGEEQLVHQQQLLLNEMKERLESAYADFNALRQRLLQLESRLADPNERQFEYEELQQNYFRLTKEFDELKLKHIAMLEENQRLTRLLADTEDKLRESNFQRQQLQKKNSFLEELNQDLQQINEQNKKLGGQLKRISEIEALLARVAAKKDEEGSE